MKKIPTIIRRDVCEVCEVLQSTPPILLLYDTKKSTFLAESPQRPYGCFDYYAGEDKKFLYKTNKGNFFLVSSKCCTTGIRFFGCSAKFEQQVDVIIPCDKKMAYDFYKVHGHEQGTLEEMEKGFEHA